MDVLRSLFKYQELGERRAKQLTDEGVIDTKLSVCRCCDVLEYYRLVRVANREHSTELLGASCYEYPGLLSAHMDRIDKHQTVLLESSPNDFCSRSLSDVIKAMSEKNDLKN